MTTTPRTYESPAHFALKRVALEWAQQNGFRIAATEVSLPNRGVRMDVAAYRPQRIKTQKGNRLISCAAVGVTAIFECKVSTPDFRRDSRSIVATLLLCECQHSCPLTHSCNGGIEAESRHQDTNPLGQRRTASAEEPSALFMRKKDTATGVATTIFIWATAILLRLQSTKNQTHTPHLT